MQINFERFGGFAGFKLSFEINLDELPLSEAETLKTALEESNFFALTSSLNPQPDHFSYKLTVQQNSQKHAVEFAENAIPASLKPLISFMENKAKNK